MQVKIVKILNPCDKVFLLLIFTIFTENKMYTLNMKISCFYINKQLRIFLFQ